MITPEQHIEVCIVALYNIACIDAIFGVTPDDLGLRGFALLCSTYRMCNGCPGKALCVRSTEINFVRMDWVRAFRYHAGRAK